MSYFCFAVCYPSWTTIEPIMFLAECVNKKKKKQTKKNL